MLTNLLNRFRKVKPKKDVHKYKKTCNLKANTEASNVRNYISEYSKVNFNIRPSPSSYPHKTNHVSDNTPTNFMCQ